MKMHITSLLLKWLRFPCLSCTNIDLMTGSRRTTLESLRQVAKSFDKAEKMDWTSRRRGSLPERTRLVIVGAGIAGLAAAKTLEDEHFDDYILLEAQDQIGGRICSIAWNSGWIEAGAQFLHGDQSELGKYSKQNGLLSDKESTEGEGPFLRDDGTLVDLNLVNEIDDLIRDTLEDCEKYADSEMEPTKSLDNIGKVLRSQMLNHLRLKNDTSEVRRTAEEIFDWNVKFLMIDNSCFTLDELSTKNWGKFRFVGGPEHLVFKNGYSSLTNCIAKKLNRKKLRLKSSVENIEWNKDISNEKNVKPIVVTLADKRRILADCIIVTSSLGYLKENHRTMFTPELPANLKKGIECLGFGLINKIFLDFGKSWWEPGTKGFQMVWCKKSDDEINFQDSGNLASWIRDLTGFDVLDDHDGVLLGWVGGRGAYVVEKLNEDEIAKSCIEALRRFLKRDNLPAPERCKRTRWNANKYVRGAYSHISTSCDEFKISPATLAEPVWGNALIDDERKNVPIVMLAGEATHEHFYSTTHGAYDTGRIQALHFLRHHVSK